MQKESPLHNCQAMNNVGSYSVLLKKLLTDHSIKGPLILKLAKLHCGICKYVCCIIACCVSETCYIETGFERYSGS